MEIPIPALSFNRNMMAVQGAPSTEEWRRVALHFQQEAMMSLNDRDYFAHRAEEELMAAAHSLGWVRSRHEELAWLYQMRVIYFDRGITGEEENEPEAELMLVHEMIVAA